MVLAHFALFLDTFVSTIFVPLFSLFYTHYQVAWQDYFGDLHCTVSHLVEVCKLIDQLTLSLFTWLHLCYNYVSGFMCSVSLCLRYLKRVHVMQIYSKSLVTILTELF